MTFRSWPTRIAVTPAKETASFGPHATTSDKCSVRYDGAIPDIASVCTATYLSQIGSQNAVAQIATPGPSSGSTCRVAGDHTTRQSAGESAAAVHGAVAAQRALVQRGTISATAAT